MKKESITKGLKIIFRHLAKYKRDLIILVFLGVISAIANGVVPYLVGRLFDAIIEPSKIFIGTAVEMPLFLFFIIIWGLVQLASNIVDWQNNLKSDQLGEGIYSDYTVSGISRILELPISFHKNQKMGEIMNRIERAANSLFTIASAIIIDLSPQFLSIIVALLITFFINPLLAFVLVGGVILYVVILIKMVSPASSLHIKMQQAYGKAFGDAYDAVFNVQEVKQVAAEQQEQKKLYKNFKLKAGSFHNKLVSIWQGLNFYQRLIVVLTQLVIFILSIIFIQKGDMTIGELIMFNGYAAMLFGPFVKIGRNWQTIQNGLTTLGRAEKIFTYPTEIYIPKNAVILPDIKGQITFENVSFVYQKKQSKVLDDVSFDIKPGEVIALVGESGVGKSTLIDLISGYYYPTAGKILIDGHNLKNLDLKFLRGKIGVVSQEIVLFNDTIKTNIRYGKFSASDKKVIEASKRAYADEFIQSFPKKYEQIVGERGIKLSVGQKQRVAIARAILRDPRILILDEPTSALDAKSEKFIQESLEKLMSGRTTFIIAHRLSTVRKADRIFVIDKGRIVEQGRHEDLIKIPNGVYRHLYELQIGLM
ncbi:MAG: ABC transporter ATP-binding protein [Candidatus Paceibacterota bacterium]